MKLNNQILSTQYAAPQCRVMTIIPRQVVCQSGHNTNPVEEGNAGDDWYD